MHPIFIPKYIGFNNDNNYGRSGVALRIESDEDVNDNDIIPEQQTATSSSHSASYTTHSSQNNHNISRTQRLFDFNKFKHQKNPQKQRQRASSNYKSTEQHDPFNFDLFSFKNHQYQSLSFSLMKNEANDKTE